MGEFGGCILSEGTEPTLSNLATSVAIAQICVGQTKRITRLHPFTFARMLKTLPHNGDAEWALQAKHTLTALTDEVNTNEIAALVQN